MLDQEEVIVDLIGIKACGQAVKMQGQLGQVLSGAVMCHEHPLQAAAPHLTVDLRGSS